MIHAFVKSIDSLLIVLYVIKCIIACDDYFLLIFVLWNEQSCLWSFQPERTQTGLYSYTATEDS